MYCIVSLPRASSIAVYSWILESVSIKYPEYKNCAELLLNIRNQHLFKNVAEVFEEIKFDSDEYIPARMQRNRRTDLEQSLIAEYDYFANVLYYKLTNMYPTPLVSIKVGKTYSTLNRFVQDSKYTTITLTRRDLRQQFLSFIVATQSQTYHGDPDKIYIHRNKMKRMRITEDMFIIWFDWLFRLHRTKKITDHTFYIEDYKEDPGKLLRALDLPELDNYSRVIQKTKDTNFADKIENLEEFNEIWNKYCSIYKDIL